MSFSINTSRGALHYCTDHNGKMEGMLSLSTSPVINPECVRRALIEGCVCQNCFSMAMHAKYSALAKLTEENYETLNSGLIPIEDFPILNVSIARAEAFGDSGTENHPMNLNRQARRNPQTIFGAWTKQFNLWDKAIQKEGKPENMILVASSYYLNRPLSRKILERYTWIDHIFTVYTADYALEHDIIIHCGLSKCIVCRRCYSKGTEVYVNEILKSEQKYYYKALAVKNLIKKHGTPIVALNAHEIGFYQGGKYHFRKVTMDGKHLYKVNQKTVSEKTGNAYKVADYINNNADAMDALMNGRTYKRMEG